MSSTLHWGPDNNANRFLKTHWEYNNNEPLSNEFHIYELVWQPDFIGFYIDDKIIGSLRPPNGGFWEFGNFTNNYENPWRGSSKMAPFDQEFYIIINLAIGGIDYFPDNAINPTQKPWKNNSPKVSN